LFTKPQLLNLGKDKFKLIVQIELSSICVNDGADIQGNEAQAATLPDTYFQIVKIGKKYQKNISYIFDAGDAKSNPLSCHLPITFLHSLIHLINGHQYAGSANLRGWRLSEIWSLR